MSAGDSAHLDDLAWQKAELRDRIRARREAFAAVRTGVSARIVSHLLASEVWRSASCVMAYLAMKSEVDLDALWSGANGPSTLAVPMIDPASLTMSACALADLGGVVAGPFGVRTPRAGGGLGDRVDRELIEPATLDLVLVPGLAFDIAGNRLGRGGGYYDRFLSRVASASPAARFVGICWSGQMVASVPTGPHDRWVHFVLTEHGLEPARR